MGAVTGGGKLQAFFADLARKVADPQTVQVGFLEGSTYPDGTSLPLVAAINEYGAPSRNQPPRPFMRTTVQRHSAEWAKGLAATLKANGYDTKAALATVGLRMKEDIQDTIATFTDPPNAPSTIARKGFATPLRDTAHMLMSVDSEVVDGTE